MRFVLAALLCIFVLQPAARADDTEVFFGQPTGSGSGNGPNILFLIDTGNTMCSSSTGSATTSRTDNYPGSGTWTVPSSTPYTVQIQTTGGAVPCQFTTGAVTSVTVTSGSTTYVQASSASTVSPTNPYYANLSTGLVTFDKSLTGKSVTISYTYNNTRLEAVKTALLNVLTNLNNEGTKLNVGLMRLSVNGSGNAAAAKGGMIVQPVTAVTSSSLATLANVLCMDLTNPSNCTKAYPNGSGSGVVVFDTPNDYPGSSGSASSPLTEMMFEAYLYFSGGGVLWGGSQSQVGPGYSYPSSPYSITPATCGTLLTNNNGVPYCTGSTGNWKYQSPIKNNCQQNYLIILSDGVMSQDTGDDLGNATKNIQAQPGFAPYLGLGTTPNGSYCSKNNLTFANAKGATSNCPDDLAYYMDTHGGINPGVPGSLVSTYTIGFDVAGASGSDAANATTLLQMIARAGGGKFFAASDESSLEGALNSVFHEVVVQNASFTSATVAVNSFNQTQDLSDLYVSVFAPSLTYRWLGNLKKYHLDSDGTIVDSAGNPAVDNVTGFFKTGAQSYWSASPDGANAPQGGAASVLPSPSSRTIYTNSNGTTSGALTYALSSLKSAANAATILGTTNTVASCPEKNGTPTASQLIDWAYGADLSTSPCTAARHDMGDPLHVKPALVIYGGSPGHPNVNDALLFETTNDGFLHAVDPVSGVEQWAFVPWQELGRLLPLYQNNTVVTRTYGLDGFIQVLKIDRNGDGIIDPTAGDRVILVFGMRRGGSNYYAVDVTQKSAPSLLWIDGPAQLPNLGQTWSAPRITKARISGVTIANGDNYVFVFGGGYSPATEDVSVPQAYVADTVGTGIYMVDAYSGQLLWRAGPDSQADLVLSAMTNAIPAEVRAIDLVGTGYAQRIYASDLGGRVWRIDLDTSGTQTSKNLATGNVLASLGGSGVANARRFFTAPDVSLIIDQTSATTFTQWVNVALGSGNHEMPISDTVTLNRFYSIRDKAMTPITDWTGYPITEANLTDVTPTVSGNTVVQAAVPLGSLGWYLTMDNYAGEKVISDAQTFANVVYFPSFLPEPRSSSAQCLQQIGVNYLYEVSVFSGMSAVPNTASNIVADGLATQLNQSGIAPSIEFFFPPQTNTDGTSTSTSTNNGTTNINNPTTKPPCKVGVETATCPTVSQARRTFWIRQGAP